MKQILIVIICLILSENCISQNEGKKNIVGINHTINSQVLKENKNIQVYLPKIYNSSNKKYPVIYLLDGQRFFLYGVSLYQSFHEFNLTPEFILVGITNVQSNRMKTFSVGAKDFTEYIENEVVSLIDKTYRTSEKRLLFGWAYAGGFGIETMMSKPNLFDGYILSSPFPVKRKMDNIKNFINQNNKLNFFFYFASADKELGVKEGTEELSSFLSKSNSNLRWNFKLLSKEEHRSTPYPALYHGILDYFENYRELSISNLEDFNKIGGMSYVYSYYKKRSDLYDIPNEMSLFTKYNLTRLSIRSNNFKQFEAFIKEFEGNKFIGSLKVSRACNIADFYIRNNKSSSAIILYEFLATKHPKSIRVHESLGDLYKSNGSEYKAKKGY